MIDWNENLPDLKPKYLAIIQMIRYLIKDEQLLPNEKLPSERKLAENLNVDRSTVSRALAELTSAGLLIKKVGSGTFVSGLPQMQLLQKRVNWNIYLDNQETPIANNYKREIFQARFSNPKILDGANNELPIDLIPDLGDLQMNWQNFLMAQNNEEDIGYLPLISAIESIHRQKNQFNLKNQMLMITGGAQQSLLLILRALLQNGDAIAFASPSYFYSSPIFETLGVRTFDVPMKDGGIDVDVLEDVILKHRHQIIDT
jgi:Transcriptional regulators containing a DNA-binding HTH domain and an aminotransferase domain (MocR family) and their eukaryotic orthologs